MRDPDDDMVLEAAANGRAEAIATFNARDFAGVVREAEEDDMRTSSNYALRLPASLKRAVEEVAREDGTTLNQFIVSAVAEKLAALKTADYFVKRAARADFAGFDRSMRRPGPPPRPDDEIPSTYRKRKSSRKPRT